MFRAKLSGHVLREALTVFVAFAGAVAGASFPAFAQHVELCHKLDPSKRVRGQLQEMTADHWTVIDERDVRIVASASVYTAECPQNGTTNTGEQRMPAGVKPVCAHKTTETVFAGSLTVIKALEPVIRRYARHHGLNLGESQEAQGVVRRYEISGSNTCPILTIVLHDQGSNNALPALIDRKAQVGMSSRPFTDAEVSQLLALGGRKSREEIEKVVALDAIVVLVSPANPVTALALCDAAHMFSGRTTGWQGAGGRPAPVRPHARTAASATAQLFRELVLEPCGAKLSPAVPLHASYTDLAAAVTADPGGTGYAPLFARGAAKAISIGGACGVTAAPEPFSVLTEDYPLARRLFLYSPFQLEENAQRFLDFIDTDEAQAALEGSGALGQTLERRSEDPRRTMSAPREPPLEDDEAARQDYFKMTAGFERLSLTYRFLLDQAKLDSKAWQDIRRLIRFLDSEPASVVLLAGFSDALGPQEKNRNLALERARAVERALRNTGAALSRHRIEAAGFGEIFPAACNDTALGREKNRRVEVWLKSQSVPAHSVDSGRQHP